MTTGSHIPFDRNGIKFYYADGEMTKADEKPILTSQTIVPDTITSADLPHKVDWPEALYFDRFAKPFAHLLDGMKIGHFQHSAVGRDFTARLLAALGAEVVVLDRSEEFVPIDTEAVSGEDRKKAAAWAKEHDLDAVLSTDGDRPLLSDANGTFFQGDALGIFTAKYLNAQSVVTPVSSNSAVEGAN